MNRLKGFFDEGLEKAEKGISDQVKTVAQATKGQVSSGQSSNPSQGTNEAAQQQAAGAQSDQATKDLVKELYAPSNKQPSHTPSSSGESKEPSEYIKEQLEKGKTPQEAMQMQSLRKKLHDEVYYIPLTQRKSHEQEVKEEEQKEEEKKMEDLQKDEEKKKKERPIAVTMVSNKAEQFPGASG